MKIAIPIFETRISPRFDHAPSVLLVTTAFNSEKILETCEIPFQKCDYIERINQLKFSGVEVVICGGISNEMLDMLKGNNIETIPWVTGDAHEALKLFLQGRLVSGAMLCHGRRIRRWRFCQQSKKRRRGKR